MKRKLLKYTLFLSIFYCCNTALKDPFDKLKTEVSPSLETYHIIQNTFIKGSKDISGNDFLSLNTLNDKTDLLNKRKKISNLDELINNHEKRIFRAHKIYTDSYLRVINMIKEDSSKYRFDTLTISDLEIVALKNIEDMFIHTKDFVQVHKDISLLWKQYFDVIEDCGDFTYNGVQFNTSSCVEEYNYIVNKLLDIEHDINQKWSEEKIWNNWRGYVSGEKYNKNRARQIEKNRQNNTIEEMSKKNRKYDSLQKVFKEDLDKAELYLENLKKSKTID